MTKTEVEKIERAAGDMCAHYCRYPLLWDEQVMNQELQESELCHNCPMTELFRDAMFAKHTDRYTQEFANETGD